MIKYFVWPKIQLYYFYLKFYRFVSIFPRCLLLYQFSSKFTRKVWFSKGWFPWPGALDIKMRPNGVWKFCQSNIFDSLFASICNIRRKTVKIHIQNKNTRNVSNFFPSSKYDKKWLSICYDPSFSKMIYDVYQKSLVPIAIYI